MTESNFKFKSGPLSFHGSKIIECSNGTQRIVKDKKNDIENSDGIIVHYTPGEYEFLQRLVRAAAKSQGEALAGSMIAIHQLSKRHP